MTSNQTPSGAQPRADGAAVQPDAGKQTVQPDAGKQTFFARYFELLDGPDPHSSLELVADDVEFSIQWAADGSRKSSQFLGGREELRGFIEAGDTSGWAHHVVHSGVSGDIEFALGET